MSHPHPYGLRSFTLGHHVSHPFTHYCKTFALWHGGEGDTGKGGWLVIDWLNSPLKKIFK